MSSRLSRIEPILVQYHFIFFQWTNERQSLIRVGRNGLNREQKLAYLPQNLYRALLVSQHNRKFRTINVISTIFRLPFVNFENKQITKTRMRKQICYSIFSIYCSWEHFNGKVNNNSSCQYRTIKPKFMKLSTHWK